MVGSQARAPSPSTSKGRNTLRWYQSWRSKLMMNESRYRVKGATQIMGTGAILVVRKLVSATIKIDGHAARAAHSTLSVQRGAGPS